MERRLGKGLGSLLGGGEVGPASATAEIPLAAIVPNPFQPRKFMDPAGLEELRDSIVQHGVLQPVVVRSAGHERYELIAGERRWRASRLAGLGTIPATVKNDVSDGEMLELALVENVQRRDLDPLEKAHGYKSMMDQLSLTQEAVAAKVGLKRSTVANQLRLLELPAVAQEALVKGMISMGHARALLGSQQPSQLLALLEATVREDLSVRELERRIREQDRPTTASSGEQTGEVRPPEMPPWMRELESRLRTSLATKVSIQPSDAARGRIVLEYFSHADLDRLTELLAPRPKL